MTKLKSRIIAGIFILTVGIGSTVSIVTDENMTNKDKIIAGVTMGAILGTAGALLIFKKDK